MQRCQPIRSVGVSIESHRRHAPSNRAFKSDAKIGRENYHFYQNYDNLWWKKHSKIRKHSFKDKPF